mgnify:CR=1 FL=1
MQSIDEIKQMDIESAGFLRNQIVRNEPVNNESMSKKLQEELEEAQANGMPEQTAEQIQQSFERAENDLTSKNKQVTKAAIITRLEMDNKQFLQNGQMVYRDSFKRSESIYRAGLRQEPEDQQVTYMESVKRSMNAKEASVISQKKNFNPIGKRDSHVISVLKELTKTVAQSGKTVSFQIGDNQISVVPQMLSNGKMGANLMVNGVKKTVNKAADKILAAVPGGQAIAVVKKAIEVLKKAMEKVKEKERKNEELQQDAVR